MSGMKGCYISAKTLLNVVHEFMEDFGTVNVDIGEIRAISQNFYAKVNGVPVYGFNVIKKLVDS